MLLKHIITAKGKTPKTVILIPGFMVKIWTMIGCNDRASSPVFSFNCSNEVQNSNIPQIAQKVVAKK
jgi:hypothetical protein